MRCEENKDKSIIARLAEMFIMNLTSKKRSKLIKILKAKKIFKL